MDKSNKRPGPSENTLSPQSLKRSKSNSPRDTITESLNLARSANSVFFSSQSPPSNTISSSTSIIQEMQNRQVSSTLEPNLNLPNVQRSAKSETTDVAILATLNQDSIYATISEQMSTSSSSDFESDAEKFTSRLEYVMEADRPRTSIGPQGDHVSSYALMKQAIYTSAYYSTADVAIMHLYQVATELKDITDGSIEAFNNSLSEINMDIRNLRKSRYYVNDDYKAKLKNLLKDEHDLLDKILGAIDRSNFNYFESIAEKITKVYLQYSNLKVNVSFPREGNIPPPKGEGARIRSALKNLHSLYEKWINKSENQLDIDTDVQAVVEALFNTFWFPKIPDDKLIDTATPEGREEWAKYSKKYKVGTLPRSNEVEILYKATAEHLRIFFTCFPLFLEAKHSIIEGLIEKISATGRIDGELAHWGMDENQQKEFLQAVRIKLPHYYSDYSPGASASESDYGSDSASETGKSHNRLSS